MQLTKIAIRAISSQKAGIRRLHWNVWVSVSQLLLHLPRFHQRGGLLAVKDQISAGGMQAGGWEDISRGRLKKARLLGRDEQQGTTRV